MNTEDLKNSLYSLSERGLELKFLESIGGGFGLAFIGLIFGISIFTMFFIEHIIEKGMSSGQLIRRFDKYNANKLKHKKYVEDLNNKNEIHLSNNSYSYISEEIINFKRDFLFEIQCKIKQLIEKIYYYKLVEISIALCLLFCFSGFIVGIFNVERAEEFYKKEISKINGYNNLINKYEIKGINLMEKEDSSDKYYVIHYKHNGKLISVDYEGTLNINENGKNEIEIVNSEIYKSLKKELKKENKTIDYPLDSFLDDGLMGVSVDSDFLIK